MTDEQPDAIGWEYSGKSTLVECKTSRADFFRDAGKSFRKHPDLGLGQHRYFLTPAGLVGFDDVPEGWGLLEVRGAGIRLVRTSKCWKANVHKERPYLVALVRYGLEAWDQDGESVVYQDGPEFTI